MACSSGNISNLIKSTKIVQQPTSRQITIGFAEVVDNTADALEDAIAATGAGTGARGVGRDFAGGLRFGH